MQPLVARPSPRGDYTALTRGCEAHVQLHRPGAVTRRSIQEFITPILQEHGVVTTRVGVGDERSDRFVRRVGFEETWRDARFVYFALTEVPFMRGKKTCLQQ